MYFVASTKKRIVAKIIDNIIGGFFLIPVFIQVGWSFFRGESFTINLYLLIGCVGFHMIQETLFLNYLGATIGKLLLGLRVLTYDEQFSKISLSQAFVRVLAGKLSVFFSYGLYAFLFLSLQRRHIIDWMADTQVVQLFPRELPPKKRLIIGPILIISFFYNGLISAYDRVKTMRYDRGNIVFESEQGESFQFDLDFRDDFDE